MTCEWFAKRYICTDKAKYKFDFRKHFVEKRLRYGWVMEIKISRNSEFDLIIEKWIIKKRWRDGINKTKLQINTLGNLTWNELNEGGPCKVKTIRARNTI